MRQVLHAVTLVVADYDEAIAWFTGVLGFVLLEDTDLGGGKRWVRVAPGGGGSALLLAQAANESQRARIGDATGGRVSFFLHTDDFDGDVARLAAAGTRFAEAPRAEAYGRVVVFLDLYGNRWDLIGPPAARTAA